MIMSKLQTYSGAVFDFADPRLQSVLPEDLAHHLARICRFKGAIHAENYSVAEHSCLMHDYTLAEDETLAYHCLVHDAEEAYTGDFPSGLKAMLSAETRAALQKIGRVVLEALGAWPLHHDVKPLDVRICATEAREFMSFEDPVWDYLRPVEPLPVELQCWGPIEAQAQWWRRYENRRRFIRRENLKGANV